jgi:hypothetical protein
MGTQFKTKENCRMDKEYDPSRLVNPASGGNHYPVGDMLIFTIILILHCICMMHSVLQFWENMAELAGL